MNCPSCDTPLAAGAKFCHNCGQDTRNTGSERAGETPPAAIEGDPTLLRPLAPTHNAIAGDYDVSSEKTIVGPLPVKTTQETHGTPLGDRYEIFKEIGHGGFAKVWTAKDKKFGHTVAVKRLRHPAVPTTEFEQTLQRFRREAEVIAGLNHRNIVKVTDRDYDEEGEYIVMEYVEGGSLKDYMLAKGGRLNLAEALPIIRGVAQGLSQAHKQNVIHRDIKPANILLHHEGNEIVPKIVDFGLARGALGESEVSVSGYGMGTPAYMAPEQRRNAKGVNHTADIYSLGKTLYELVSGDTPPENVDPGKIPPPPLLAKIIFKCIQNKPDERYFSADELIVDLDAVGQQPAAVPAGSMDGLADENACPSCGKINKPESRYCEKCGLGLTRVCPACGADGNIKRKHCGTCGTDIDLFLKVCDVAENMRRMSADKRYSRVVKEFNQLPVELDLHSKEGAALVVEVRRMQAEAQAALDRSAKLEGDLQTAQEQHDWAGALAAVQQYKELNPSEEKYDALVQTLEERLDEQHWQQARAQAEKQANNRAYSEAGAALENYQKNHPQGRFAAEAEQLTQQLQEQNLSWLWEQTAAEAKGCYEGGDLQKAKWIYENFAAKQKRHPQVSTACERAKAIGDEMVRRQDDTAWREALQKFESALQKRQAGEAETALKEYAKGYLKGRHLEEIKDQQARIAQATETWGWEREETQAEALAKKGETEAAAEHYAHFAKSQPRHAFATEAQRRSEKWTATAKECAAQLLLQAGQAEQEHQLFSAKKILEEAQRTCPVASRATEHQATIAKLIVTADKIAQTGVSALLNKDYAAAIKLLQAALAINQEDEIALLNLPKAQQALARERELRRKRLRLLLRLFMGLVITGISLELGFMAKRGYWRFRFRTAVEQRDVPAAEKAVQHLATTDSAHTDVNRLRALVKMITDQKSDLKRLETVFKQYAPDQHAEVVNLLQRSQTEASLDIAEQNAKEVRDRIGKFSSQYQAVFESASVCEQVMTLAKTQEDLPRYAPDHWPDLWQEYERIRAAKQSGEALLRFDALTQNVSNTFTLARQRRAEEQAWRIFQEEGATVEREFMDHPLAKQLTADIRALQAALQQAGVMGSNVVLLGQANTLFSNTLLTAQTNLRRLELVTGQMEALQKQKSDLGAQENDLRQLAPPAWAAFDQAWQTVEAASSLQTLGVKLDAADTALAKALAEGRQRQSERAEMQGARQQADQLIANLKNHVLSAVAQADVEPVVKAYAVANKTGQVPAGFLSARQGFVDCSQAAAALQKRMATARAASLRLEQLTVNAQTEDARLRAAAPESMGQFDRATQEASVAKTLAEFTRAKSAALKALSDAFDKADATPASKQEGNK